MVSEEPEDSPAIPGENRELQLFWEISQSLISKGYLDEILNLIVTTTAAVMDSKICSVMILNEKTDELSIAATQSLSTAYLHKPKIKVGESVSGVAVKERRVVYVEDVTKDPIYRFPDVAKAEGLVSLVSVPMQIQDRAIGVINCYTSQKRLFSYQEIRVLQAVANQAAVAIEHTKLRRENAEVKQALEERKLIERAKSLLMTHKGLKENEAYEMIQKTSRDRRKSMAEIANAILLFYSFGEGESGKAPS